MQNTADRRDWTAAEEADTVALAQAGAPEALAAVITAHAGVVEAHVRRFIRPGVEMEDLVGEANVALLEAVYRFDAAKGARLWSYAFPYVNEAVTGYLARTAGAVSVPGSSLRRQWSHGDMPSVDAAMTAPLSIVPGSDEDDGRTAPGTIREDALPSYDDSTEPAPLLNGLDAEDLRDALAHLAPPRRAALTLLYGLDDGVSRSYAEVACIMDVTPKAVDRLRSKALDDLRRVLEAVEV